ncbi:FG-GAP-like repeat-containing protein [Isoptericola dokdonensis]|uniref:FG-GAP repeat protein n=1 Tax=Isoptericola dokdonensis DS-3 TaxID=1300344 RepID=A0A168FRL4_9MICO|nr:FG-GAP-like repeat-containing protein [Isoptericola dokdonensis]ANC32359.1 FG-GAP repeat protein [Isoptericola dokdonensis DS-3]
MRNPRTGRAAQLASTLVAASLVLAAAPQVATAADDETLTLSTTEAEALADRLGAVVYGGQDALETIEAETGVSLDAADAPSAAAADAGAGATADVDPTTPVTFTATSSLEGARGLGVTLPAAGQKYFTLHSLGQVQLSRPDGSAVWQRTATSLIADWGVKPVRVWEREIYPPQVLMGYNAVSPFTPTSDAGYDTGDLTGDGTPDVVFSAAFGMNPPTGVTLPGSTMRAGTIVTVLDGATGTMAWSKVYPFAALAQVVGDTLLVGDAPRQNQYAPAAATATLTGIRFTSADGVLTPVSTWTYDTGLTSAATWGDVEDLGDGRVAVSWNQRRTDTTPAAGRTLVLDTADGSVVWRTDAGLYGRQLHLDGARGRVVALEQADTSDAVRYAIVAYDVATGERTVLSTRENALATAMTVGNAAQGKGTEYVVSESTLDANLYLNSSTVRVLDGKDGATVRWTSTTKRGADNHGDAPSTWSLDAAGGMLVATSQDDTGMSTADNPGGLRYGTVTGYTDAGKVRWQHEGTEASPVFQQVYRSGGTDHVRVVDQGQNVRTYTVAQGKEKSLVPLQGDLSSGQAVDLDGDGKDDVVAGGSSRGVWAWKGTSLVKGAPKELWRATVPGEVHDVETGDVNGDGRPEVVVAADTATVVLDGATGNVLTTIDGGGQYVRSVTVADVDGDGKDEVVVPTDALRVHNARGKLLWVYEAPAEAGDVVFSDAVTGDGRVYVQYSEVGALAVADAVENGVALDGRTGAELWTADPVAPASAADGKLHGALLRNAVFASPNIPYADGHAVAYTWIASMAPNAADTSALPSPRVVVEIRDGRTGELLRQEATGSPWSHDNFFIDGPGDPLYALSFGTLRGFGADGADTSSSVVSPLRGVEFITGPGGRKLLAGGTEGGVGAWDPSVLTTGWSFQNGVGTGSASGGRSYLAGDLDGDGGDELVSLNFDSHGYDRMAQSLGSRVLSLDDSTHKMVTFKLS